jgi:hypothetical protein
MKHPWDFPHLPEELKKKDVLLEERLQADWPKKDWICKKVRHKIKELLKI